MAPRSSRFAVTITTAVVLAFAVNVADGQAHSAFADLGQDPTGVTFYTGTSHPTGSAQINVNGGAPGYLNGISGGSFGGASGEATIQGITSAQTAIIALAIHVTDTAGASHSLSTSNDPALVDIVNDLNANFAGLTAYSFASAPVFSSDAMALSVGEGTNGGQNFDILLAGPSQATSIGGQYLTVSFFNEIGNLDGITALNVTDIGAVPEPGTCTLFAGLLVGAVSLGRRRTASI